MEVKESVEIYPDDPKPCVEDTNCVGFTIEVPRIPCTVEVKESVEIYPDDPRPDTELTKEFAVAVVLIIPCTVDVKESVEI